MTGQGTAHAAEVDEPISSSASDAQIEMGFLSSHATGQFDESAAEITGTGVANSISIREDGLGVIALENEDKTKPGTAMFFDANEPEALTIGEVGETTYAFVGFERIGGIAAFFLTRRR